MNGQEIDWSKVDAKWIAYSIDKFGMQALHDAAPIFSHIAGKWASAGVRMDLGLMQIFPNFNPAMTLQMRPGKPAAVPQPVQERVKSKLPQDVASTTPIDHMVSSPPPLEPQNTVDYKAVVADLLALLRVVEACGDDTGGTVAHAIATAEKALAITPPIKSRQKPKIKARATNKGKK